MIQKDNFFLRLENINLVFNQLQIISERMNKILLPEYPGNNLLFHCVSHGNAVDALNLL